MFTVWLIFYLILIWFTDFDINLIYFVFFLFVFIYYYFLLNINNVSYVRLDKQNID